MSKKMKIKMSREEIWEGTHVTRNICKAKPVRNEYINEDLLNKVTKLHSNSSIRAMNSMERTMMLQDYLRNRVTLQGVDRNVMISTFLKKLRESENVEAGRRLFKELDNYERREIDEDREPGKVEVTVDIEGGTFSIFGDTIQM